MWKRVAPLLVAALVLGLAAACQSSSTEREEGGTAGVAVTTVAPTAVVVAQAPKRGGTLVIAAGTDPGQLNPAITTAGGTHFVAGSIYNGLVDLDKDFKPAPDLAERWTVSDDGKTYTFTLRQGVKWHDGQPFTAADVKFTFEEVLLKYHARTKTGVEPVLAGIDTPNDSTVVFRFKQPYAPLLQQLNVIEAPIVARHIYQGSDPQNNLANLKPVGTGPFKFVEYRKGERVTMERNPDYFKPGQPHVDRLIFSIIPQAQTQLLAFEQGRAARGPMASTLWAFDQSLPAFDYSAQKANETLDQAGVAKGGDGTRFKLTAVFPSAQSKMAEILKENLAAVGVNLDLKLLDTNEANETVFMKRDFDLGFASYCNGPDPEIGVRRIFDSTNIKPVLFSNGAAYRNPRVDDLFNRGVSEITREKRVPVYAELQKIAVADLPYFWLYETQGAYAVKSDVKDLRPWSSSLAEYAWLDR